MDALTSQKINDPQFFALVLDHITSGGALPELCQSLKLNYSRVVEWVYSDPERANSYAAALRARNEWTVQKILLELRDIALADIRLAYDENNNLLPVNEWPPALARVVAGVEVTEEKDGGQVIGYTKRVKMWDKLRALELLGKNLRLFNEHIELSARASLEDIVAGSMIEAAPAAAPDDSQKKIENNFPAATPTPADTRAHAQNPAELCAPEIENSDVGSPDENFPGIPGNEGMR